jgi:putative transposase
MQQQHEQQVQELYAEIGRLTTELSWLKKKSGLNPESR